MDILLVIDHLSSGGAQRQLVLLACELSARGHGVGEALSRAAVAEATHRGAKNVSLTSRSSREAANRLYLRLGFEAYDTNVYRYTI